MLNYILLIQLQSKHGYPSARASRLVENIYCWLLSQMMKFIIILNLLLLKFSASIMAISQSRSEESSFNYQKIFTKVAGQGNCRIEQFYSFYHSTHTAV